MSEQGKGRDPELARRILDHVEAGGRFTATGRAIARKGES